MGASTSIFCLTLLNPITALFFIALFSGFGKIRRDTNYASAGLLVTAVFAGSTLWWFILSGITSIFRERIGRSYLRWVNRISGGVIAIFGLMILLSLMRQRAL